MKAEIVETFKHVHTNEKMYRVKLTYTSGGVKFDVYNKEQLVRCFGEDMLNETTENLKYPNQRAIAMCDEYGKVIKTFPSIKLAVQAVAPYCRYAHNNLTHYNAVYRALRKGSFAYGHYWKYADGKGGERSAK